MRDVAILIKNNVARLKMPKSDSGGGIIRDRKTRLDRAENKQRERKRKREIDKNKVLIEKSPTFDGKSCKEAKLVDALD